MQISGEERRWGFDHWLRTGRISLPRSGERIELKFNPYHDPHDGRFTFGPGGGSVRRGAERTTRGLERRAALVSAGPEPEPRGGGNSRAYEIPMTLDQAMPELRSTPGGAIFAVADNVFSLTGPANEMTAEFLQDQAKQLGAEIRTLDPRWHYDEIGATDALKNQLVSVQALNAKVNDLRFKRAALIAQLRGDYAPLQLETLRFLQRKTDSAYEEGIALLGQGRLKIRLSEPEALGNYIDARVRLQLRKTYNQFDADSLGNGRVRVNRRENNSSERTYRRPDARVHDVAFDVTLTRKTLGTAQIRGFFNTDFRPTRVIIVRPSQLGLHHSYVISRPEIRK